METYLNERLHKFNQETANAYRTNWGTVLEFQQGTKMNFLGTDLTPIDVF